VLVAWLAADDAPAQGTRFERGRLFRIDRAGVPPSYVFGTLHSNDARVVRALPPAVTAALDATRSSAFETLLTDGDVATLLAAARYEGEGRLTDHVDAATLARIRDALDSDAPDTATLARVKPWAVLLMLAEVREPGPPALDAVLRAQARARRHAVLALELPDEQVASLDAIPLASQLALMRWALDTREARGADHEATMRAWLAGDLAGLWRLSLEPGKRDPALAGHLRALLKHLISDRNLLFAHRLHLPLARGRVFVAVGALHLYGAEGLLALIEKQGYRVTRVL
jgi:uncharacterized protein YbaP (TraB family)